MNFAFPEEMLHCLQPPTSPDNLPVSVDANAILLGRQTSAESLPRQQQHLPQFHGIINTTNFADQLQHSSQPTFSFSPSPTQLLQYHSLPPANPTPALLFPNSQYFSLNGSPHFPQCSGFPLPPLKQSDGAICRTSSCPPHVGTNATAEVDRPPPPDKILPSTKEPSYRKRKTDKAPNSKVISTLDDCKEKRRTKREGEVPESNNGENSTGTSKENSKVTEVQKPDYIHVRARRGQATDSHSLAERVRREKISERMKYLQDLVPGCNKITGKAGMLDEIINYVQSLQRQVEFLSMKLAAVNPRVDFNIDNFFSKEMSVNSLGAEIMASQGSFQFNFNPPVLVDHVTPCCGADMAIGPPQEMALRRTTSAPLAAPDGSLIDSNFHFQVHAASSACWNVESRSHSLYKLAEVEDPGREPVFPPDQSIRGHPDGSNIKMEMSGPASRNF